MTAVARLTARERALLGGTPVDVDAQLRALVDASRVLDAVPVAHALIGGIAVGVRSGQPRATVDVDLAVDSAASIDRIIEAMVDVGFVLRGTFAHSVNFRHPSGEPVQLAFDARFDLAIGRAEPVEVTGAVIPVVTREDLIVMKEWAAQAPSRRRSKALRDQADIELLRGDVADEDEGW
jgi:hypothetical protein